MINSKLYLIEHNPIINTHQTGISKELMNKITFKMLSLMGKIVTQPSWY